MGKYKTVVAVVFTVCLLFLGAFLPVLVTALQDHTTLNRTGYADSTAVVLEFSTRHNLSTVEKLILLNQSNSYTISENETKMTAEQVLSCVQTHMAQYTDAELLPPLDYSQCQSVPAICIDDATQAHCIIWAVCIENSDTDLLTVIVDDETGVILSVDYQAFEQNLDLTSERYHHKIEAFMEIFLSQLELPEDSFITDVAPNYEEPESGTDYISRYFSLTDSAGREIIIAFRVTAYGSFYTYFQY